MAGPSISTAIPLRRFQLGDFQAVVLGEIESPDPVRYRYILALLRAGQTKPEFFVTCEQNPRAQRTAGSHRLRVISSAFDEDMGSSDDWADLDRFAEKAVALAAHVLGLGEVRATPLR